MTFLIEVALQGSLHMLAILVVIIPEQAELPADTQGGGPLHTIHLWGTHIIVLHISLSYKEHILLYYVSIVT